MVEDGQFLKSALHRVEVAVTATLAAAETLVAKLRSRGIAWRARRLAPDIGRLDRDAVYSIYRRALAHSPSNRVSSGEILRFLTELSEFNKSRIAAGDLLARQQDLEPCLFDRSSDVGFDPHYLFHTAWAARLLAEHRPTTHVDIGSHLMFVALCSAFIEIEHYDYRAVQLPLDNLRTGSANLVALPWQTGSISSLSCMHVVEHVGLGRYGDPIDPLADRAAMSEFARVLAPSGQLLFVVPVGRPRVQFNAHRVYDFDAVVRGFNGLDLAEFSLIQNRWQPIDPGRSRPGSCSGGSYACGCFRFLKPAGHG